MRDELCLSVPSTLQVFLSVLVYLVVVFLLDHFVLSGLLRTELSVCYLFKVASNLKMN